MILHKLIGSAEAGKYLPFALSQLRALNAVHGDGGYFSHRWVIDGIEINVQQSPPAQYVRLIGTPANPVYEFVTSDFLSARTFSSPGYEPPAYLFGAIQAHALRVQFNGLAVNNTKATSTPIYSTNLIPTEGKSWTERDIGDPPGSNIETRSQGYFKSWAWWQIQYFQEKLWFYKNQSDVVLASCFGATRASTACLGLGDYYRSNLGVADGSTYDVGYDITPTVMRAGKGVTEGVFGPYMGTESWPRAGAMQIVEWKVGGIVKDTRTYFIMGDNKGRLHVYPAKAYFDDPAVLDALGPNPSNFGNALEGIGDIPSTGSTLINAKVITPDYPAWVSLADPDTRNVLLWWNWRFNKDGTKAATVALKDEVRPSWFFYNDPSVFNPNFTYSWYAYREDSFGDTYTAYPPGVVDPEGHTGWPPFHTSKKGLPARNYTPGLVEISINIEIFGPNEDDYTASAKVERAEHFYEAGRYFVDCGYLYNDSRLTDPNDLDEDGKPKQMPEDTLMASQIDVYADANFYYGGWFFKPSTGTQESDPAKFDPATCQILCSVDATYVVRRMDTDAEIKRIALDRRREVHPYTFWNAPYKDPADQPPLVPTGFAAPDPTARTLDRTYQQVRLWYAWRDFSLNGPIANSRPHYHAILHMADLSSLSFVTTAAHIKYPGYTYHPTGPTSGYWVATVHVDTYTKRIVGFNQEMAVKARDYYYNNVQYDRSFEGDYVFYQNVDPEPEFAEIPPGQRISIPAHLHTSTIYNGVALDALNFGVYKTLSAHPKGHFIASSADSIEGVHFMCDVVSIKQSDGTFWTGSLKDYFNNAFTQERDETYWNDSTDGADVGSFNICGYWLPYREAA